MATYDADLQAAVDSTSIARAGGETDLEKRLRDELAQRDIETADDAWITRTAEKIGSDPDYMIEDEPSDYESRRRHE